MAAAVKHSKQRDAIEAYLKSTYDHPTADIVYQNVSKGIPKHQPGYNIQKPCFPCRSR